MDSEANAYILINRKIAQAALWQFDIPLIPLKRAISLIGFDGQFSRPINHLLLVTTRIHGRIFVNILLLAADLGSHDVILGRK